MVLSQWVGFSINWRSIKAHSISTEEATGGLLLCVIIARFDDRCFHSSKVHVFIVLTLYTVIVLIKEQGCDGLNDRCFDSSSNRYFDNGHIIAALMIP